MTKEELDSWLNNTMYSAIILDRAAKEYYNRYIKKDDEWNFYGGFNIAKWEISHGGGFNTAQWRSTEEIESNSFDALVLEILPKILADMKASNETIPNFEGLNNE